MEADMASPHRQYAGSLSTTIYNESESTAGVPTPEMTNVNDAYFDKQVRIAVLYTEVCIGLFGGVFVCIWLCANPRRKSRVNTVIAHLTVSDLLVITCAMLPQLVWEYDRQWRLGWFGCKLFKFTQSAVIMASTNMLLVLSFDRHRAIWSPLRSQPAVWRMTLVGWLAAVVCSLPQLVVFHVNHVTAAGPFQDMTVCESIWRYRPMYERQVYLVYVGVVLFYAPCILLWVCYASIFYKIAKRARDGHPVATASGKERLQSTSRGNLPAAKVKTFKMAIVIGLAFVVCSLPYHVLEMIYSFSDHQRASGRVAAVIGAMAVANSAINPYIFMLFNMSASDAWLCRHLAKTRDTTLSMRTDFTSAGSGRGWTSRRLRGVSASTSTSKSAGTVDKSAGTGDDSARTGDKSVGMGDKSAGTGDKSAGTGEPAQNAA